MGFLGKLTAAAIRTVVAPAILVRDIATAPVDAIDGDDFKRTKGNARALRRCVRDAMEDLES